MKSLFSLTMLALLFSYPVDAKKGANREARINACSEKSAGDPCSFQAKKSERNGICKEGKKNAAVLICRGEDGGKRGKKGDHSTILKELNLSKDQLVKLKEYKEKDKAKRLERKPLKDKIKGLKEDIKNGFISNISDEKMLAIHREISSNRAKLEELRFSKMINLKNVLDEEQRKKYLALEETRKEKFKKRRNRKKTMNN